MASREIVLCNAVRTAIGAYGRQPESRPATELGATGRQRRAGPRPSSIRPEIGTVVMGNVIQAGNKMNPARQAAIRRRHSGRGPGHDREPGMRLRRPGHRLGGAGSHAGHARQRHRRRDGEHGQAPYLVAGGRWGYRMGDAQIYDSMLRDGLNDAFSGRAFRLAHRDLGQIPPDHAGGSRTVGRTIAEALFGRAGGGQIQGRDRAGRNAQPERAEGFRQGRAKPARHDAGEPRQASSGLPQGRHDHGRQCARA